MSDGLQPFGNNAQQWNFLIRLPVVVQDEQLLCFVKCSFVGDKAGVRAIEDHMDDLHAEVGDDGLVAAAKAFLGLSSIEAEPEEVSSAVDEYLRQLTSNDDTSEV